MLGFYNYTVILTYVSLLISSIGIYLAAAGHPFYALCCLLASGICDMFDGKIARTRKKSTAEEKRFGIQIDSLCDVICFGVLPSAIGVSLVASQSLSVRIGVWALAALYILCGLIRLAYFNVTEETRQAKEGGRRTHFQGVPITTAAVVFPLVYGVAELLFSFGGIPAAIAPWLYPAFLFITGAAFITPVRVRKPRGVGLTILGIIGLCEFGFMLWLLLR
jgi:CDP-diacylglycerol--serine O-phosphatidyltransferase